MKINYLVNIPIAYLFLYIAIIAQYLLYFSQLIGIKGLSYNKIVTIKWWPNIFFYIASLYNKLVY